MGGKLLHVGRVLLPDRPSREGARGAESLQGQQRRGFGYRANRADFVPGSRSNFYSQRTNAAGCTATIASVGAGDRRSDIVSGAQNSQQESGNGETVKKKKPVHSRIRGSNVGVFHNRHVPRSESSRSAFFGHNKNVHVRP